MYIFASLSMQFRSQNNQFWLKIRMARLICSRCFCYPDLHQNYNYSFIYCWCNLNRKDKKIMSLPVSRFFTDYCSEMKQTCKSNLYVNTSIILTNKLSLLSHVKPKFGKENLTLLKLFLIFKISYKVYFWKIKNLQHN